MNTRISLHHALLGAFLASAQLSSAVIIVSESFGGGTGALNGTSADTFDAAITTAGGSSTWAAVSAFDANGTVTGNSSTSVNGSAYLNLGSYINDRKGASDGKFIATATIDADGLSSWYGLSFFAGNSVTSGNTFIQEGTGTIVHRSEEAGDVVDAWGGPGTGLGVDGGTTAYTSGATLSIILDLTTAGGYDGLTNFGDIEFQVNGSTIGTKQEFATDRTFGSFGLTQIGGADGDANKLGYATSLQLEQIPEPSAALLLSGLGVLMLLRRRR